MYPGLQDTRQTVTPTSRSQLASPFGITKFSQMAPEKTQSNNLNIKIYMFVGDVELKNIKIITKMLFRKKIFLFHYSGHDATKR